MSTKSISLFDRAIMLKAIRRLLQETQSARPAEEPGDVRHAGRRAPHLRAALHLEGAVRLRPADRPLAAVHRRLRQLRRGRGRGPRQGPGRALRASRKQLVASAAARTARLDRSTPPSCARATSSSSRPANSSPATARSSRGHRLGRRVGHHRRIRAGHPRSGGDRSAVTGGTRVLSDRSSSASPESRRTFLDRMISLVEGATRQKTPNEIALTILLSALTFIFLLVIITLKPFGIYSGTSPSRSRR
jgi:hypothetical protein